MKTFVLRDAIDQLGAVATLPDVAIRIMRIASDPSATEEDLLTVLHTDPPLAARVLKVVNSAFYRRQREVGALRAAVRMLGVDAIRNIALAASLHRLFRGGRGVGNFDPASLWAHSVAVAAAARRIALETKAVEPEEALLAGLLHDIGLIVAMQARPREFTQLLQRAISEPHARFLDLEEEVLGATHEEFGGALCDAWKFPAALAHSCRSHHDVRVLPVDAGAMPAVVHVADAIAARLGEGFTRTVEPSAPHGETLDALGLSAASLEYITALAREDATTAAAVLAA